jgi:hypothetical protein
MAETNNNNKIITLVGFNENVGDGKNPDTMDIINETDPLYYLSILYRKLTEQFNVPVEVLDWIDPKNDWTKKNLIIIGPVWNYH